MSMRKSLPIQLLNGVIVASLFTLYLFCGGLEARAAAQDVPLFSLPTVTDGAIIDSRQYRGKAVLVNFWATWCPPCRKEIPYMQSLHEEFGDKGLAVLGVSVDEGGSKLVQRFIAKSKINYPVVMADAQIMRQFGGVRGVPYSFLLDKTGRIQKVYPGYTEHHILQKDISALLGLSAKD